MRTLREVLQDAKEKRVAIGHFNVSDSTQFTAIVSAARELSLPVIIGVTENERDFIGMENVVAMVRSERNQGREVYLNADHHHSTKACKRAIDAGFDSVVFDGVKLSKEENISKTREVVEYAKKKAPRFTRLARGDQHIDALVEAELGYIGTSSKVLDELPEGINLDMLPTAEDAQDFLKQTGVDALAPAVGNLHGMLKGGNNPSLKIDLISQIRNALPDTHLVLHGGSGLTDEDFTGAIKAGINCVHMNTAIRRAYRSGIEEAFESDPDQIAPYKYLVKARDAVSEVVKNRLELFSSS